MAEKSKIEWTDASWTPIRARNLKTGKVGWHCEHATTGCEFCYAETLNKRLGTGLPFKPGHRSDIEIFLDDKMLLAPLRWKKPRMIFVCSMTDLFADFVPDEWIDKVFAVMALCPQHTFQVLTKRAERMRDYLTGPHRVRIARVIVSLIKDEKDWRGARAVAAIHSVEPLPNVWLGVSTERQKEADERIPLLLQTPAAVRFISAEPLLGPIDLQWIAEPDEDADGVIDALLGCNWIDGQGVGVSFRPARPGHTDRIMTREVVNVRDAKLDWVIVGGESGNDARPFHVEWADGIVSECKEAGVPCFVKQFGSNPFSDGYPLELKNRKGGDPTEWPDRLRTREMPHAL